MGKGSGCLANVLIGIPAIYLAVGFIFTNFISPNSGYNVLNWPGYFSPSSREERVKTFRKEWEEAIRRRSVTLGSGSSEDEITKYARKMAQTYGDSAKKLVIKQLIAPPQIKEKVLRSIDEILGE